MSDLCRVFTIQNGEVIKGAKNGDLNIYHSGKRVMVVEIDYSGSNNPANYKLSMGNENAMTNDSVVVVIDVGLGVFGNIFGSSGYDHDNTGDRIGWRCQRKSCGFSKNDIMEKPDICPKCGAGSETVKIKQPSVFAFRDFSEKAITIDNVVDEVCGLFQESFSKKLIDTSPTFVFGKFPEEIKVLWRVFSILPNGKRNKLMVALVPKNVVFRVIHSVTESGDFQAKYYKWDGKKFHTATETERNFLKDF